MLNKLIASLFLKPKVIKSGQPATLSGEFNLMPKIVSINILILGNLFQNSLNVSEIGLLYRWLKKDAIIFHSRYCRILINLKDGSEEREPNQKLKNS